MSAPLPFYELQYQSAPNPQMRNIFREFSVEVDYNGLFGYDRSGYYIP